MAGAGFVALSARSVLRNPVWWSSRVVIASLQADHPRSHVAIHGRGVEAFNAGRLQEADSLFGDALRLVPWHYQTVAEAALVDAVVGDWRSADARLHRATALYPAAPEAYRLFSRRLLEAGRPAEARRVALEGVARADGPVGPLWQLVAATWAEEGRDEAAQRARRAAGLEP